MPRSLVSMLSLIDFNGRPLGQGLLAETFGQLMLEHGYVYMCNSYEEFDPVAFCKGLGPFIPNYNGSVVSDVRPEPGMDDVYHAGNTRDLVPHTEGYDFEKVPPRYVALWCVTPCLGGGGETTLGDAYEFMSTLSDAEKKRLKESEFEWKVADGLIRQGFDFRTRHPVIEETDRGVIIRFSCVNMLHQDDPFAVGLQQRVAKFFDNHHVAVEYKRGDILIWDNWRMLHSRNAFGDRGRHLRRVQIADSS
jgi:alpha-ketoglutarate-dependent taurine dioxygenase